MYFDKKGETGATHALDQFPVKKIEYLGKSKDAYVLFPYGMYANVGAGALGLRFPIQGNHDNSAVIASSDRDRPQLEETEVAIFHPPSSSYIVFNKNGGVDIDSKSTLTVNAPTVNISAETVNITGNLNVTGQTAFTGSVTANGKTIDDTHGHTQAADSGGNAEQPITGVT